MEWELWPRERLLDMRIRDLRGELRPNAGRRALVKQLGKGFIPAFVQFRRRQPCR